MNINRLAGIAALIVIFIMGCSGYGIIKTQTATDNKMTLAELIENWEDYHVYYRTRVNQEPEEMMFDPKNDDKRLVGDDFWIKITDQQTLSETMEIIEINWYGGVIQIIEGPDRQFFGYMYVYCDSHISYCLSSSIPKLVDERTLYLN